MKRIFLVIASLIAITCYSQSRAKHTIEVTGKVGSSSFRYYVSGFPSNSLNSVNFGVNGDYYLNETWSIQTGLLYQKMGGTTGNTKYEVEYVNIPINMNWHFGKTKKWNLNFGMIQSLKANNSLSQNILGASIKNTQTAINFGVGYRIKINNKIGILLDYQFLSGIDSIDKNEIYFITNKGGNFNIGTIIKL